jgi:hypothetical protein
VATFRKQIFTALLVTIVFFGCKNVNSVQDKPKIDPEIIGDWYSVNSDVLFVGPSQRIGGYKITDEGIMIHLAVETATGRIIVEPNTKPDSLYANDGMVIITRYNSDYGSRVDTGTYIIKHDSITLNFKIFKYIFQRTKIGDIVTEPIISELSALVNNELYSNVKISAAPSAYGIFYPWNTPTALEIKSESINFKINNFNGVGQYKLGGISPNIGYWIDFEGDYYLYYSTSDKDSGTVTVNSFNINNSRCSGTFSYTAVYYDLNPNIKSVKDIKNGNFNVPIY